MHVQTERYAYMQIDTQECTRTNWLTHGQKKQTHIHKEVMYRYTGSHTQRSYVDTQAYIHKEVTLTNRHTYTKNLCRHTDIHTQ